MGLLGGQTCTFLVLRVPMPSVYNTNDIKNGSQQI